MIVVDTHVLIWAVDGDARLGRTARGAIEEAGSTDGIAVSAITPWEIVLLADKGRLRLGCDAAVTACPTRFPSNTPDRLTVGRRRSPVPSPGLRRDPARTTALPRFPLSRLEATRQPTARPAADGQYFDIFWPQPGPAATLQLGRDVHPERILGARSAMMTRHVVDGHALPHPRRREQGVAISIDGGRNERQTAGGVLREARPRLRARRWSFDFDVPPANAPLRCSSVGAR